MTATESKEEKRKCRIGGILGLSWGSDLPRREAILLTCVLIAFTALLASVITDSMMFTNQNNATPSSASASASGSSLASSQELSGGMRKKPRFCNPVPQPLPQVSPETDEASHRVGATIKAKKHTDDRSGEAIAATNLARDMGHNGKVEKAHKLYEHALALAPDHPDILNDFGEFLEKKQQDIVSAEHLYCKALVRSPSHMKAMSNRKRTLPLVEEIDQNSFNRIDNKRDVLMSVPDNHPGLRRQIQEDYFRHIYHSAAIEGNTFTLSQTRSLVESRLAIGGKSIVEHNEILGMDAALHFINSSLIHRIGDIRVQDILDLHHRVLGFVDPLEAGRFRTTQVFVGDFTPPSAIDVRVLVEEFIEWLNSDEALSLHPIELAALAHYKLVYIHPFYDGNGRTSRLLMNLIIMQAGYPPIIIKVDEKLEYYKHLQTANDGDVRPFIRFIARCTERTIDDYLVASIENINVQKSISRFSSHMDDGRTIILEDQSSENDQYTP